jgi:hypothetical protein
MNSSLGGRDVTLSPYPFVELFGEVRLVLVRLQVVDMDVEAATRVVCYWMDELGVCFTL